MTTENKRVITVENLFEIDINITGETAFKLFVSAEEEDGPSLQDVEGHVRNWHDTSEIKSGKSLVRALRLAGFVSFTQSQLNKYLDNQNKEDEKTSELP